MVKQRHQFFVVLLVCMDGFVVAIACLLAWVLRRWQVEGFAPRSWETYFKEPLVLFAVPISLYALWAFRLYRPRRDRSLVNELADVLKASIAAMAALVVVLWAVGNDTIRGVAPYGPAELFGGEIAPGRLQLYTLAALLPLLLGAHRVVFRIVLRIIRRRGWNLRHVAIIGVGRLGQIVCRTIERNSWTGINVAYFVSHHAATNRQECMGLPVYGGLDDLERTIQEHRVDSVYVAVPAACGASVPLLLAQLDRFALDVKIVPDVQPRFMPESMVLTELDGMPVLSYRGSPHSALGGVGKRALDILGAVAAMLLFSPIFLAVTLAVRLTSPGPVIFKQKRVSVGGKVFKIYKFRTMYHVEDERGPRVAGAPGWTERNDPRVTPVGRWLRKTSLDELPQLLNVLKGQMSLVGPRPERPELIERFREDWRGYMLRQHVKAGMTGWAQVNGLRGQTSLKKRLQYDLFYVRHWSLWFDLRILWLTLFRGFIHKNAH